jgi:hypothetical protein
VASLLIGNRPLQNRNVRHVLPKTNKDEEEEGRFIINYPVNECRDFKQREKSTFGTIALLALSQMSDKCHKFLKSVLFSPNFFPSFF